MRLDDFLFKIKFRFLSTTGDTSLYESKDGAYYLRLTPYSPRDQENTHAQLYGQLLHNKIGYVRLTSGSYADLTALLLRLNYQPMLAFHRQRMLKLLLDD